MPNASQHTNLELEETLLGIVIDWSDAEIKGIGISMGKELAITLLTRSQQRVRDCVATSKHKTHEKGLFSSIAS